MPAEVTGFIWAAFCVTLALLVTSYAGWVVGLIFLGGALVTIFYWIYWEKLRRKEKRINGVGTALCIFGLLTMAAIFVWFIASPLIGVFLCASSLIGVLVGLLIAGGGSGSNSH